MNNESNRPQYPIDSDTNADVNVDNGLWNYVQSLSPETMAKLSRPESNEVFQVMERNILGLLGHLPSEQFDVTINTNREHLGRLLASAMMSGYFLRNAEQRMGFEKSAKSWQKDLFESD